MIRSEIRATALAVCVAISLIVSACTSRDRDATAGANSPRIGAGSARSKELRTTANSPLAASSSSEMRCWVMRESLDELSVKLDCWVPMVKCMSWQAPPTEVVYEEKEQAARELVSRAGFRSPPKGVTLTTSSPDSGFLVTYDKPSSAPAYRRCNAWEQLAACCPGMDADAVPVFCHARVSPGGHRRLVLFGLVGTDRLYAYVVSPGTLSERPKVLSRTGVKHQECYTNIGRGPASKFTFYAGQPDPNDGSHFTARYSLDGQWGLIDGWLQDDEWVRFRVLSGPAGMPKAYYEWIEPLTAQLGNLD